MEQIECFETLSYKIQTLGNYPEENIQHTEHGESLKSRKTTNLSEPEMQNGVRPILYLRYNIMFLKPAV
jgi:hypothetical protein